MFNWGNISSTFDFLSTPTKETDKDRRTESSSIEKTNKAKTVYSEPEPNSLAASPSMEPDEPPEQESTATHLLHLEEELSRQRSCLLLQAFMSKSLSKRVGYALLNWKHAVAEQALLQKLSTLLTQNQDLAARCRSAMEDLMGLHQIQEESKQLQAQKSELEVALSNVRKKLTALQLSNESLEHDAKKQFLHHRATHDLVSKLQMERDTLSKQLQEIQAFLHATVETADSSKQREEQLLKERETLQYNVRRLEQIVIELEVKLSAVPSSLCRHRGSCVIHSLRGLIRSFVFGAGLRLSWQLFNSLVIKSSIPSRTGYLITLKQSIQELVQWGLFTGSHAGLYKACQCVLRHVKKPDDSSNAYNGYISGAVAGLSFLTNPNLFVSSYAVARSLDLLLSAHVVKHAHRLLPMLAVNEGKVVTLLLSLLSAAAVAGHMLVPEYLPVHLRHIISRLSHSLSLAWPLSSRLSVQDCFKPLSLPFQTSVPLQSVNGSMRFSFCLNVFLSVVQNRFALSKHQQPLGTLALSSARSAACVAGYVAAFKSVSWLLRTIRGERYFVDIILSLVTAGVSLDMESLVRRRELVLYLFSSLIQMGVYSCLGNRKFGLSPLRLRSLSFISFLVSSSLILGTSNRHPSALPPAVLRVIRNFYSSS
eukprot:GILK01009762.1.p1 GENE.GILK01009762.1~~GILK01009762.1.p1  ORF type:complete len:650 (-),score=115.87 GILK01009762.1:141-2090(-)